MRKVLPFSSSSSLKPFSATSRISAEATSKLSRAQDLANERSKIGEVSSIRARENSLQSRPLLVVVTLVEIERHCPLAIFHVAGRTDDQRCVQSIENGVAMTTLSMCHPMSTLHSPSVGGERKTQGHAASQLRQIAHILMTRTTELSLTGRRALPSLPSRQCLRCQQNIARDAVPVVP